MTLLSPAPLAPHVPVRTSTPLRQLPLLLALVILVSAAVLLLSGLGATPPFLMGLAVVAAAVAGIAALRVAQLRQAIGRIGDGVRALGAEPARPPVPVPALAPLSRAVEDLTGRVADLSAAAAALEALPWPVLRFDAAGRLASANRAGRRVLRWSEDAAAVQGTDPAGFTDDDGRNLAGLVGRWGFWVAEGRRYAVETALLPGDTGGRVLAFRDISAQDLFVAAVEQALEAAAAGGQPPPMPAFGDAGLDTAATGIAAIAARVSGTVARLTDRLDALARGDLTVSPALAGGGGRG